MLSDSMVLNRSPSQYSKPIQSFRCTCCFCSISMEVRRGDGRNAPAAFTHLGVLFQRWLEITSCRTITPYTPIRISLFSISRTMNATAPTNDYEATPRKARRRQRHRKPRVERGAVDNDPIGETRSGGKHQRLDEANGKDRKHTESRGKSSTYAFNASAADTSSTSQ